MATGLSVNRLIRTSVNLSPVAAARRGFGTLLVCGDSDVIDVVERIRSYTTLETVIAATEEALADMSTSIAMQIVSDEDPEEWT